MEYVPYHRWGTYELHQRVSCYDRIMNVHAKWGLHQKYNLNYLSQSRITITHLAEWRLVPSKGNTLDRKMLSIVPRPKHTYLWLYPWLFGSRDMREPQHELVIEVGEAQEVVELQLEYPPTDIMDCIDVQIVKKGLATILNSQHQVHVLMMVSWEQNILKMMKHNYQLNENCDLKTRTLALKTYIFA